ncbi:response regulator NasT [Cyclonatronum proteinivorum]|uniref:Response regulator NasT n=1 Tax=Cyclonatronum proteinivorum TaxID=1457365 RepID=A0A345UGU7_9BACT|nr:response regulator [Cyclonatronum proteinivorum]AXI99698.1 response regulator NasT [Cyclonatronum proteinivorum]
MKKILVVEDEVMLQIVISKMVEKAGFIPVGRVKSAKAATEAVHTHRPDLILMDVQLIGESNGIAAAREIRTFSKAPIIFLTGFHDALKEADLDGLQPCTLLTKPFDYQELSGKIQQAFERAEQL